jgi:5,10-methylenetetrahydromethanopterin reductase
MRALEEVAPGRTFLGLGTGDGAVYGIGMKPAKATTLQDAIGQIKQHMPDGVPVHLAAGGPRIAGVAGGTGAELILGTGAHRGAIDELLVSARSAANGGEVTPWLLMIFNLADGDGKEAKLRARSEVRASVIAYARHALSTRLSSSGLEGPIKDELGAALERYDFTAHARPGDSPNARLGDSMSPELLAFLEERFAVIGTPEEAAERLAEIAERTGVTRFWLACNVDDPAGALRHAGRLVSRTGG